MKLIAATNNEHKLTEIRAILGDNFEVMSMKDVGFDNDIPEDGDTLIENSHIKAATVARFLDKNKFEPPFIVIADDTGLMVDALDGAPGVHTARYAGGDGHDSEANMNLLLKNLEGKDNRKAHFSTLITIIDKKAPYLTKISYCEGRVDGTILTEKHGEHGFGYDPIFCPDGHDKSFAELGEDIKNKISHRAIAVQKMAENLKE